MELRLLEQRAAPADARQLVAAHLGHVRGERQVELRGDVREHLVAAVRARADDVVAACRLDDRRRPGRPARTGRRPSPRARRRRATPRASAPAARARRRRFDEDERHATPSCCITSTTRGAAAGPSPRISACLREPSGTTSRSFSSFDAGRSTGTRVERLGLRAQLRRHRRIARQVQAFLHRHDRRQRRRRTRRGRPAPPARSARGRRRPSAPSAR